MISCVFSWIMYNDFRILSWALSCMHSRLFRPHQRSKKRTRQGYFRSHAQIRKGKNYVPNKYIYIFQNVLYIHTDFGNFINQRNNPMIFLLTSPHTNSWVSSKSITIFDTSSLRAIIMSFSTTGFTLIKTRKCVPASHLWGRNSNEERYMIWRNIGRAEC